MSAPPVLVTGTHRSGTTWIGDMLSKDQHTLYIHEPFNVPLQQRRGRNAPSFYWYHAIDKGEQRPVVRSYLAGFQNNTWNNILQNYYRRNWRVSAKWLRLAFNTHKRFVYKDPLALLSAPWFAEQFNANVVVLIRHPAAFAASLKVKNWQFPFSDLANQPLVVDNVPQNLREGILQYAHSRPDIIHQSALLWSVLHFFIQKYREQYPEWNFVRHEDISTDPMHHFRGLYDRLGLSYNEHVEQAILQSSKGSLPSDNSTRTNMLQRDSSANISTWKSRLTTEEINFLKEATEPISRHFYSENDW